MALKAVFWDNDGVLVDTESLYFEASAQTLADCGIELTREAFLDISLRRGESVFTLAGDGVDTEALRKIRNERYADLLRTRKVILPGVKEVLEALYGRVRMAVVTSSLRSHFDIVHQELGLLRYFDFVLTREDYRYSKPHPEPYLTALRKTGLDPSECLVIEDSRRGLCAAKEAGISCWMVPGEFTSERDFSSAERLLTGIEEVPSLLFGDSGDG